MRSTMLPSLRGLGPRRGAGPGPGRRLAPHRPAGSAVGSRPRGRAWRLVTGLAALITLAALAVLPGSAAARGSAARAGGSATFTQRTVASPAAFAAAAEGAVTPIPSVAGQSMIQLQSPSPL